MVMIRSWLVMLAMFAAAACTEATREFSAPPTLTPTTPPAVPSTPRPVTPAPSTAAPATTPPASPSPTSAATSAPSPSPTRTASPAPTATTSAQPTLPPGASLPPMPSQPPLQNATLLVSGTSSFALPAGQTIVLDAADVARSRGASPSPNTTLAWTIAWRATESLTSAWYRLSARNELGRGRWGTADLGNATFELRNDSGATVYGELGYIIGTR